MSEGADPAAWRLERGEPGVARCHGWFRRNARRLAAVLRARVVPTRSPDLVEAVLDGCDLPAVMPTESGKSLGFQLPGALLSETTLVVSPPVVLMKDQVDELGRRGIAAAVLHAHLGGADRRAAVPGGAAGAHPAAPRCP